MSKHFKDKNVRHRFPGNITNNITEDYIEQGKRPPKKQQFSLPTSYLFFILFLVLSVFIAVIVIERKLPPGLKIHDVRRHPDRFIAERAMNYLHNLTKLGPRIAGSRVNEIDAVHLLVTEIKQIISRAKSVHVIELDVQKASGAYSLEFLDGMTVMYHDMQNVVVKVGSRMNSPYSLLINCHFDSVTDSPGASDDGAGCAVMLEMLNVIAQSDRILRHNIIFLFNGAEENFMPASHGFITQHKWSKEVQAFINLEACGAGGRELLFQAGPNHPWILQTYSQEVPYPYASSLAQEIFQSGIIPGDTDYRIFRDFGHISGLDFAWSTNGYVYHTKFDTVDYIPLGSLQRTGDNILALAKAMVSGHHLSSVEKYKHGNLVFFDFLGAFVIRWTEFVSNFVNVSVIALSLYALYRNKVSFSKEYVGYGKQLTRCILGIFVSWLSALVTTLMIAVALNLLGRTMSWFARPVWIFFLYVCPTILVPMIVLLFHSRQLKKKLQSHWKVFQMYYDGYQLIWTMVLLLCVICKIRSGFIPLLWVFFPACGNLIQSAFFQKWKDWRWLALHVGTVGLPFTQSFYLMLGALYLFIPIMGRSGSGNNSELIIAAMVGILFSLLLSFVTPLIILVQNPGKVFSLLLGIVLISVGVLLLTPFGFPYSGDPNSPAPQRFMIAHTDRTFYDEFNKIAMKSSGYWIVDLDINSPHTVDHLVPEMADAILLDEDCDRYLYCGQPYLVPAQSFIWLTHWLPGPAPIIKIPVKMSIVKREKVFDGEKISFHITGPDHIGVMMSPKEGLTLKEWTVTNDAPLPSSQWNDRNTYFIFFARALEPLPMKFTIYLQMPSNHTGPVLDLALTSHVMHGEHKASNDFKRFLSKFPSWTAVTSWTADRKSVV